MRIRFALLASLALFGVSNAGHAAAECNPNVIDYNNLVEMLSLSTYGCAKRQLSKEEFDNALSALEACLQVDEHKDQAALTLARIYYFGVQPHLQPDFDKVSTYLDQCSLGECHYLMGIFYDNSLGGKERDLPKALSYFGVAAELGNIPANQALAWRHANGIGVQKSCFKARDHFIPVGRAMAKIVEDQVIRSVPKVNKLTLDHLERQSTQSPQDVVDFYMYSADTSDANALLFLGQVFYLSIGGVKRDFEMARDYFSQAAKAGSSAALGYLGMMDFYGQALEKPNYRRAYNNFRRSAKDKNAIGLTGLGLMYWKGVEVVKDLEEALKNFKHASDLGHPEATYYAGKVLSEIDSVANEDKIFTTHLAAMKSGFFLSAFELAMLSAEKDMSCSLAQFLFQTFLSKHPDLDELNLANDLYYEGHDLAALSRFLYAAEQGIDFSIFNVAFILDEAAKKQPADSESLYRRALVWWSQAADTGDVEAKLRAGDYFYYGHGLDKPSPVTAAAYYRQCLEKKNAQAAFNLGYMHQKGEGVPLDYRMAARYYEQAVHDGASDTPEAWLPVRLATIFLSMALWHRNITTKASSFSRSLVISIISIILGTIGIAYSAMRKRTVRPHQNNPNDRINVVVGNMQAPNHSETPTYPTPNTSSPTESSPSFNDADSGDSSPLIESHDNMTD